VTNTVLEMTIPTTNKIIILGFIIICIIVCSPVMAINKNDLLTYYKSQSVSTDTTIFDSTDNGYPTIHRNTPISSPILQNQISPSFRNLNIRQTIGSFEIEREPASEPVGELQYLQGLYLDPLSGVYYTFAFDDAGNTFSEPVRWTSVRV